MKLYRHNNEWFYEGRHYIIRETHIWMLPVRWVELWWVSHKEARDE